MGINQLIELMESSAPISIDSILLTNQKRILELATAIADKKNTNELFAVKSIDFALAMQV